MTLESGVESLVESSFVIEKAKFRFHSHNIFKFMVAFVERMN